MTNASMSGTSGGPVVTYTMGIATSAPTLITCAALATSTGMVFRCGARRRSPLNSSNIVLASALVGGKARSELNVGICAYFAPNTELTVKRGAECRTFQDVRAFQNERLDVRSDQSPEALLGQTRR